MKRRDTNRFEDIVQNRERRRNQQDGMGDLTAAEHLVVMDLGPVIEEILKDVGKAEWGRALFLKRYVIIVPKRSLSCTRSSGKGVKELVWAVRSMVPRRHSNGRAGLHRECEEYSIAARLNSEDQTVGFTVSGAESFDTEGTDRSALMSAVHKALASGPDITFD